MHPVIYLNRTMLAATKARVAPVSSAMLYGRGVFTTVAIRQEPELKELLGVPQPVVVAGVLALGYPERRATRLTRKPVESFATVDRYDGPAFTA